MDKVFSRVVDLLELEFQAQEFCQAMLGRANGSRGFVARPGHTRVFGCNEFVEHGVVVFEATVKSVVVAAAAKMNGTDKIDFEWLVATGAGCCLDCFAIPYDGRVE